MSAARRRGQPLATLGLILVGWVGLRATLWEAPFPAPAVGLPDPAFVGARPGRALAAAAAPEAAPAARTHSASPPSLTVRPPHHPVAALPERPARVIELPVAPRPAALAGTPHLAAAHQLLLLAAVGALPLPPLLVRRESLVPPAAPSPVMPSPRALATASRWSGDGWVLVRRGAGGLAAAPSFATYGASQAGAVLRYALAPGSGRAPQAYVRLTRALGGFEEGELAAGVSLRPVSALPVQLLGEARLQRSGGGTRLRPAASLVTALAPQPLPLGAEAELYAQAGYVGGKPATPFFDAQLTAERPVAGAGPAELRLGAGAWAGGQQGAARLDLGPRASLRLRLGETPSRLALDWRFRVAGNAAPASGPTLTIAAGF